MNPCTCGHDAHWHLKHASGKDHSIIRMSRCLSKVKNERGFPADCACRAYKARAA